MDEPTKLPLTIPDPKRGLSKTESKKLLNALHVKSKQYATDYDEMKQRVAQLSAQLMSAAQILEAVVRRHGSQTFERSEIQGRCAHGAIKWDVTDSRITVSLNELILVPHKHEKVR